VVLWHSEAASTWSTTRLRNVKRTWVSYGSPARLVKRGTGRRARVPAPRDTGQEIWVPTGKYAAGTGGACKATSPKPSKGPIEYTLLGKGTTDPGLCHGTSAIAFYRILQSHSSRALLRCNAITCGLRPDAVETGRSAAQAARGADALWIASNFKTASWGRFREAGRPVVALQPGRASVTFSHADCRGEYPAG